MQAGKASRVKTAPLLVHVVGIFSAHKQGAQVQTASTLFTVPVPLLACLLVSVMQADSASGVSQGIAVYLSGWHVGRIHHACSRHCVATPALLGADL